MPNCVWLQKENCQWKVQKQGAHWWIYPRNVTDQLWRIIAFCFSPYNPNKKFSKCIFHTWKFWTVKYYKISSLWLTPSCYIFENLSQTFLTILLESFNFDIGATTSVYTIFGEKVYILLDKKDSSKRRKEEIWILVPKYLQRQRRAVLRMFATVLPVCNFFGQVSRFYLINYCRFYLINYCLHSSQCRCHDWRTLNFTDIQKSFICQILYLDGGFNIWRNEIKFCFHSIQMKLRCLKMDGLFLAF